MKIYVLSDIHLGVGKSNDFLLDKDEFLVTLKTLSQTCDYLVLLGDVFECWESNFDSQYNTFCKISNKYYDIVNFIETTDNIILISGNHDVVVWQMKLIDKVKRHKVIEHGLFKLYFAHGHQADVFNSTYWWVGRVITRLCGLAETYIDPDIDTDMTKLAHTFVSSSINNLTMEHGLILALKNKYDFVVYGHTHNPQVVLGSANHRPVIYANSGSVAYKADLIDLIRIDCDLTLTVSHLQYSVKNNSVVNLVNKEIIVK